MSVRQVCACLKNLKIKGIVKVAPEPSWFLAVPFDKVVDLVVQRRRQEAQVAIDDKDTILSKWNSIILSDSSVKK